MFETVAVVSQQLSDRSSADVSVRVVIARSEWVTAYPVADRSNAGMQHAAWMLMHLPADLDQQHLCCRSQACCL